MPADKTKLPKVRQWTDKEFLKMWRLKNKGWSNTQIGRAIGRSASAVSAQVRASYDYMRD